MAEAQDLLEDVLVDESEKEDLRRELVEFLKDFRDKKDDEGNPLIQFPKNFDAISDAMTRQDLISTEDQTWSKFLLGEKFDSDSKKNFEGGRYSDLVKESQSEMMVNRGLAEIHLLDKQINKLDKQARQLPGGSRGEASGKGMKRRVDGATFITDNGAASVNENEQCSTSIPNSARSTATVDSESSDYNNNFNMRGTPRLSRSDGLNPTENLDYEKQDSARLAPTSPSRPGQTPEELLKQENAELRLEAILKMDEEDEESGECTNVWKSLSRYGCSEESQRRLEDIDRQLSLHAQSSSRMSAHLSEQLSQSIFALSNQDVRDSLIGPSLSTTPTVFPPLPGTNTKPHDGSVDAPARKERKENILQTQRLNRLTKEYEKKIDSLIHKVHTEELNISGLVSSSLNYPPPPASFLPSIAAASSGGSKCDNLQKESTRSAEEIILERLITMEDVENLIETLCYGRNDDTASEGAGDVVSATKEHNLQMDHLLASIRPDVARLATDRALRDDCSSEVSGGSSLSHAECTVTSEHFSSRQSYQRRLEEYLESYAAEKREESGGVDNILADKSSCHREVGNANEGDHDYFDHGSLSRMTAHELKEANNRKENPSVRMNDDDNARIQTLIQDIMSKKTSTQEGEASQAAVRDETELVINLEHAHHKINAILNRANSSAAVNIQMEGYEDT